MRIRGVRYMVDARAAVQAAICALSHDLRTPIVGMVGMANLALDPGASDEDMRLAISAMRQAAQAMQRMMDGLTARRHHERLYAGQMNGELTAVIGRQAALKGQRLTLDLNALGEGCFEGDASAIWRVLLNLLTNAVKYTPEGGEIGLSTRLDALDSGDCVVFVVRDNGVGMTPDFMRTMYEPHTRAAATSAKPGQGIGLSVVRELVRRMGGTIDAVSEPGRGTAFTVRVPLIRAVAEDIAAPMSLAGVRILLAEDNALCAQIETRLLAREGAVVTLVCDGEQAAARFAMGDTFDAVLLDLHMPGMDGASAAQAIRRTPAGRNVPILAMTASMDESELRAACEAGMDGAITKPLDVQSVCRALADSRRRAPCQ